MTTLYINTAALDNRCASVRSSTLLTQAFPLALTSGEIARPFTVLLVDGAGGYDAAGGGGGYSIKMAVGIPGAVPVAGTMPIA